MKFSAIVGLPPLPRAFRNPLTRLASRYGSDKGLTTRGHGYTRVYHHFFHPIRNEVRSLLEIGLQRPRRHWRVTKVTDAPSLRMWRRYFPNAFLVGFDIREFAVRDIANCAIICGDQGNQADLARAVAASPEGYDIIIDDGSHASSHQQQSFATLFPCLEPGGYYAIEDLHWQPPDEERPEVERTVTLFKRFAASRSLSGRYFDDPQLSRDIDQVWLFDSLESNDPLCSADALLIVRKKQ